MTIRMEMEEKKGVLRITTNKEDQQRIVTLLAMFGLYYQEYEEVLWTAQTSWERIKDLL